MPGMSLRNDSFDSELEGDQLKAVKNIEQSSRLLVSWGKILYNFDFSER